MDTNSKPTTASYARYKVGFINRITYDDGNYKTLSGEVDEEDINDDELSIFTSNHEEASQVTDQVYDAEASVDTLLREQQMSPQPTHKPLKFNLDLNDIGLGARGCEVLLHFLTPEDKRIHMIDPLVLSREKDKERGMNTSNDIYLQQRQYKYTRNQQKLLKLLHPTLHNSTTTSSSTSILSSRGSKPVISSPRVQATGSRTENTQPSSSSSSSSLTSSPPSADLTGNRSPTSIPSDNGLSSARSPRQARMRASNTNNTNNNRVRNNNNSGTSTVSNESSITSPSLLSIYSNIAYTTERDPWGCFMDLLADCGDDVAQFTHTTHHHHYQQQQQQQVESSRDKGHRENNCGLRNQVKSSSSTTTTTGEQLMKMFDNDNGDDNNDGDDGKSTNTNTNNNINHNTRDKKSARNRGSKEKGSKEKSHVDNNNNNTTTNTTTNDTKTATTSSHSRCCSCCSCCRCVCVGVDTINCHEL